jgi:hypothetical protein
MAITVQPEAAMYSLTIMQGTVLGMTIVAMTGALVLGVLRGFPRALRRVAAVIECPLLQRTATAELDRDAWTLRSVDVVRCSVLGARPSALCTNACLARPPRTS